MKSKVLQHKLYNGVNAVNEKLVKLYTTCFIQSIYFSTVFSSLTHMPV